MELGESENISGKMEAPDPVHKPLDVLLEGYLWKKHQKNKLWKGWHKRYFVLRDRRLLYYRSEKESKGGGRPRGLVTLGANSTVDFVRGDTKDNKSKREIHKFMVLVPPTGMISLGGLSLSEAEKWVEQLKKTIAGLKTEGSIKGEEESSDSDDEEVIVSRAPSAMGFEPCVDKIGEKKLLSEKGEKLEASEDQQNSNPALPPQEMPLMSPTADVPVSLDGARKHGILAKKGWVKGWHQRYFILGAGSMSYFRMDLKNSNQSITTRNLRDKVIFTRNYKVDFEGQREKGKKTGLFPFTVVGPGCSWKLATKSAEESRAWVEEIQQAISSSPEQAPSKLNGQHRQNVPGIQTSPRTSQKVPTSRESRDVSPKRRQHKRTYTNPLPNVRFSNTRAVTGNCRTSPPMSPILSSALVLRSGQPSPMTTGRFTAFKPQRKEGWLWKKYVRQKYWMGWHQRYFVLSGNYLQYFKDDRKSRALGSVILGSDCCVDFTESTLKVKKKKTLFPFTVFLDGPPTEIPSLTNALLLATASVKEAQEWTMALRRAVYGPQSSDNTKFNIQESDDELDGKELEELAVKYGDQIQLWTHTAYDSKCGGGVVGIYKKPDHDFFFVPPSGPNVGPEQTMDAIFTVIDMSWPRALPPDLKALPRYGAELRYGDSFQLCDEQGRIWSNESYYAAPKKRTDLRVKTEHHLTFLKIGCRAGDSVRYGEHPIRINACQANKKKGKVVRNYKRGTSRLVGGYLNCLGQGKEIHFTIQRAEGGLRRVASIPCHLELYLINSETTEVLRVYNDVNPDENISLGVVQGGVEKLRIAIGSVSGRADTTLDLEIPQIQPSGNPIQSFTRIKKLHDNLHLHCAWECEKWWQSARTARSNKSRFSFMWSILLALAVWSCVKTVMSGDELLVVSALIMLLSVTPILILVQRLKDGPGVATTFPSVPTSRATWSINLSVTKNPTSRDRSSRDLKVDEIVKGVDSSLDSVDGKIPRQLVGKIAAGSSLRYIAPGGLPEICTYTNSHYNNFKVRAGPNYKKNKKKLSSKREMFDLVSVDVIRTDRKETNLMPHLKFTPETVDAMIDRKIRLDSKRPDLKIPAVFTVHLSWPNYQPPSPLWGKAIVDGPGIVFSLVFKACDWLDDKENDVPGVGLLSKFINSPLDSKFRERFKVLPVLVNVDNCSIEGLVKGIVTRFNGRPFLSRPQHSFTDGVMVQINSKGNQVEIPYQNITIDGYLFPFLARSTTYSLFDKSTSMIIDMGFIIEAREDEEMPERVLGHTRFNFLDRQVFPRWCEEDCDAEAKHGS